MGGKIGTPHITEEERAEMRATLNRLAQLIKRSNGRLTAGRISLECGYSASQIPRQMDLSGKHRRPPTRPVVARVREWLRQFDEAFPDGPPWEELDEADHVKFDPLDLKNAYSREAPSGLDPRANRHYADIIAFSNSSSNYLEN